jgi:cytochrome oxidase Cu insertion factor (SCO1/SenC/PrrC family)
MKTNVIITIIAFTLAVLLSPGGTVLACDKHARHKKAKQGKNKAGVVNSSRGKSQRAQMPTNPKAHDEHADHHPSAGEATATSGEQHHDLSSKAADEATTGMNIPDLEVFDQDGRRMKFYSDLVKGKTVAINFIFTTCTTVCPPLGATFARVQKELTNGSNADVQLISISVDPVTDTPERLKAWRAKFKAGDGWTLVTGDKQIIDKLLNALSAATAQRDDHSAIVIIGNDQTKRWTRTVGLARPSQIVSLISEVQNKNSVVQTSMKGVNQ